MDRSRNRYALLSDSEDMDSTEILQQSIKTMNLESAESSSPIAASQPAVKGQTKEKDVAPRSTMRSRFTMKAAPNVQPTRERVPQDDERIGRPTRNRPALPAALPMPDPEPEPEPETPDEWTEPGKKEKTRLRKAKGILPRKEMFNDRGKRGFDRVSGSQKSSVKAVDKRDGGGARNWGRFSDSYELLQEEVDVMSLDNPESKTTLKPSKSDDGITKELTLPEYKEKVKGTQTAPVYNLRKAGEGTDQRQWDKLHLLKKKTEEEASRKEAAPVHSGHHKSSLKAVKSINVLFSDEPYASHYRGHRGGKSGPETSNASQQSAHVKESDSKTTPVPTFDESDFPSLGGH